ncbi:MAG TPA: GNAT family N-acetyltransferase [Mycobacterium sp.]|nr:GNAT family N-acetyltransferase [Mycobacterium sp.]
MTRILPLGWATDLAVLKHMGSTVEHRGDHLVVRTAQNPDFHWGNCIFVTDPDAVDDADRWVQTFRRAVPGADWIAIGLARMPANKEEWATSGLELEMDDVLATATLPRQTAPPVGYDVRALVGADWEQVVVRAMTENAETAEHEPRSHERFARARAQSQRDLVERGVAQFVGAFFEDRPVAELGIVDCGGTARYQNVGTASEHRGRGIASHLLGVAARWASSRGCKQWVIVTEAVNPAGRVYRKAGFELVAPSVQAYLAPRP